MGLRMGERKSVTRETVREYRRATRRRKGKLLDQVARLNGWTRHHAGWMLRWWGHAVYCWQDGQRVKIVVGRRRSIQFRRCYYDQPVYTALKQIWQWYGWMCGKRLVGVLRHQLAVLEKYGELSLTPEVRAKLERISAATVDRLLAEDKRQLLVRGRTHTKPSRRLLHEIPIRTFSEWQHARPGEMGADLVGHDGGYGGGEHLFTLVVTDRVTQWTELRAVLKRVVALNRLCGGAAAGELLLPSQKLVEKTRQGARTRRTYDAARTPYQRVLAAPEVAEAVKERLRRQFEELNPVALRQEAERLYARLRRLSERREESTRDAG